MRRAVTFTCALTCAFIWLPVLSPAAAPLDAHELSRRLDELYRSATSRGTMRMTVTTPYYERTLRMRVWSRGMEETLVRILYPPKEEGTATLKRGNEMWNYLPKIKKTIRVPPSMMMASWMGSDFTNDDLMRETTWESDYDVSLAPAPPAGRVGLVYIPRPGAPVTWSKVVVWLDAERLLPLAEEYHDEKGRMARVMRFEEVGLLGGRTLPKRVVLTPLSEDKKGHVTVMEYEAMEFDIRLAPDTFTLTRLQSE
jgi:outer membrane lipoprotein-sorting protein